MAASSRARPAACCAALHLALLAAHGTAANGFGPGSACAAGGFKSNVKAHVEEDGLVATPATNATDCCTQCAKRGSCTTWCYGWAGGNGCHMSPHPALNQSSKSGFSSGAKSPLPPPPPLPPAAGTKPHIVVFVADDLGYANVGYTRAEYNAAAPEVQTPHIDGLVRSGIELKRNYVYKVCSPTRSAFQSGRLPVHVNFNNAAVPQAYNPADPMSGFQGVPRNMSCIANKLKKAGYSTYQIGKWDVGMATPDHTPQGRGYDHSFGYFEHDNDYWTSLPWATYNDSGYSRECGAYIVDMWRANQTHGGGAVGENGSRPTSSNAAALPFGCNGTVLGYEEYKFGQYALEIIERLPYSNAPTAVHSSSSSSSNTDPNSAPPPPPLSPLFLNYNFHIAHEPIELPRVYFDKQKVLTEASGVGDYSYRRTTYQGMVNFMDDVIANITLKLKERSMWQNTLYIFSSDNGGPSFGGSHHLAANNYPLRGSKTTDLEGGDGIIHIADWYATLCALAGVDPYDERAAAAGLPQIDSIDMWQYLSGLATTSPRTEVHLSPTAFVSGRYKYLAADVDLACWGGPLYPNASTAAGPHAGEFGSPCTTTLPCSKNGGCLFDLKADPAEYIDLAADPSYSTVFGTLKRQLDMANRNNFDPTRGPFSMLACKAARRYGGYWGPFLP